MKPSVSRLRLILTSIGLLLSAGLFGCGEDSGAVDTTGKPPLGCVITSPLLSYTAQSSSFTLVPSTANFTLLPGYTRTLDVFVEPLATSTEQVTITAQNLPEGLTVDPVTVAVGSTAQLKFHAARNLASSCFTGGQGILSAQLPITLGGDSVLGYSSAQLAMNVALENPNFKPRKTTLPVLDIETTDAAPIATNADYVSGKMTITDSVNAANNYSGTLNVKGHGNSTWFIAPKKPYRVKLDSKSGLFGMAASKNWILLANYFDKSMLRTDLAFHLSNVFSVGWTPSAVFVEMYLNGEYKGTYQLAEKVEVDKNRLNIGELDDTDNTDEAVTGGYIGEIDSHKNETYMMVSPSGLPIGIDDPDPPTVAQGEYFSSRVNDAEQAIFSPSFTDPYEGWAAHFDQASLINWFLVEELMGNGDAAFGSSVYFYKPRSDPRFYMGPVWDFDVSAGNDNYDAIQDPSVPWISVNANWYARLLTDPAFLAAVKARWTTIRPQLADMNTYIDGRATLLTQAARNNFSRWTTIGVKVWPNSEAAGSYAGEVDFLKSWMGKRLVYMDSQYLQ